MDGDASGRVVFTNTKGGSELSLPFFFFSPSLRDPDAHPLIARWAYENQMHSLTAEHTR